MAREMVRETTSYYNDLSSPISESIKKTWEREISLAESQRMTNLSAMDLLGARDVDPQIPAPISSDAQSFQSDKPWLQMALSIEEHQYVATNVKMLERCSFQKKIRIDIQDRVRRLQKEPRESPRLEVERLRHDLTSQFLLLQSLRTPEDYRNISDPYDLDDWSSDDAFDHLDDDEIQPERQQNQRHSIPADILPPERRPIVLPSTHMPNADALRKSEMRLRIKQAAQYLTAVREAVAEKSFQYSHVMRVAPTKGVRTRSRALITKINDRIGYCCRVYRCARAALVRLNADDQTLNKFQCLSAEDVKSSTAILDPNTPGASSQRLSWIWQKRSGAAVSVPESMLECGSKTNSIIIIQYSLNIQSSGFIGYEPEHKSTDGMKS